MPQECLLSNKHTDAGLEAGEDKCVWRMERYAAALDGAIILYMYSICQWVPRKNYTCIVFRRFEQKQSRGSAYSQKEINRGKLLIFFSLSGILSEVRQIAGPFGVSHSKQAAVSKRS